MNSRSLAHLSDAQLLVEVKALAAGERHATVRLIASLAELDARRLYLGEGFPSLFAYCTQCLHLAEHSAYNRIEVARVARQWPEVLDRLSDGGLTLSNARLLAPHLTANNHRALLEAARHKSKREVEQLVATLHPQPDVPASIRRLPVPKPAEPPSETARLVDAPISEIQTVSGGSLCLWSGHATAGGCSCRERTAIAFAHASSRRHRWPRNATRCSSQSAGRPRQAAPRTRICWHAVPNGDPPKSSIALDAARDAPRANQAGERRRARVPAADRRVAPHSGVSETRSLGSRWRTVRVHGKPGAMC